ncbi:MAG: hypothetical protein K0B05_14440 [Bacteroidales bacterium]|nr:hypothetical protein [Bacteroidales bacterium]
MKDAYINRKYIVITLVVLASAALIIRLFEYRSLKIHTACRLKTMF